MTQVAFALHFDSLNEAYGFPENYNDPCFERVMDRFLAIAEEYGITYTIFMIGRDLESADYRKRVAQWAKAGHEIGNHSYSHPVNFGSLDENTLRSELTRTHDLILSAIGTRPVGFAAPAWSTSKLHLKVLSEMGYEYDASTFPSWLRFAALAKLLWIKRFTPIAKDIIFQKDLLNPLIGHRKPWVLPSGLTELPLPTGFARTACWHTMAFLLNWKHFEFLLRNTLNQSPFFYYVIHPADLIGPEDSWNGITPKMERMDVPLAVKQETLRRAVEIILEGGRKVGTMRSLARQVRTATPVPSLPSRDLKEVGS